MAIGKAYFDTGFILDMLRRYERIYIFDDTKGRVQEILLEFVKSKKMVSNSLLVSIMTDISEYGCETKRITTEEYENIKDLYQMYEFSDKVQIISEDFRYGSMLNYIDNGCLIVEEMLTAVSYER